MTLGQALRESEKEEFGISLINIQEGLKLSLKKASFIKSKGIYSELLRKIKAGIFKA
ncbi:hypothetical protein [Adhaeribacter radiodurans]|uniref:Uncharacterized protein n=1 Tax=Adhaeribacter radiodurans TaxID=2745197 RepID=A0A7L7L1Q9_9BACT|nr:hypothetical protein [Adhaeribacter radiodurans]QMU26727.1 hypothetical protein HUW48_01170 [Adhaeribacter radiodurans]